MDRGRCRGANAAGRLSKRHYLRMNRLRDIGLQLIQSLWFFPALFAAVAAFGAIGSIRVDMALDASLGEGSKLAQTYPWIFSASPDGARSMLSAIAGALITAAGVTFSGVLVALSIASSQYTSRVLRSFTADRPNQIMLGLILASFIYSLLVLRSIGLNNDTFVPELSVLISILMGMLGVSTLLLFVHNVARSIQASDILARVAAETIVSIKGTFPTESGSGARDALPDQGMAHARSDRLDLGEEDWVSVRAGKSGYVRAVDAGALLSAAVDADSVVRMGAFVGEFVYEGASLASYVSTGKLEPNAQKELDQRVQSAHTIGTFRTVEQDAAFGLRQLVDIALCALSPGVNDTTTAVMAIHRITEALCVAARGTPPSLLRFKDGKLRLQALHHDLPTLMALGYDQIRQCSDGNAATVHALLLAWIQLVRTSKSDAIRAKLRRMLDDLLNYQETTDALANGSWPRATSAHEKLTALLAAV